MLTDIQIAQKNKKVSILEIAEKLGLNEENINLFGKYKGKINHKLLKTLKDKKDGELILVTAMSPTPAGEGKTTITVGLGDALASLNKKTVICLREPSLGPVFGVKGGATGGGYAQVVPMEDVNLHFTGDLHAISAANNLLAAIIDNHIFQGNILDIDPRNISFKRVVDMNDRQLRNIVDGLGGKTNGMPREDGFDITVASEIMAVFCLSSNLVELKEKIANIIIGYTFDKKPVTCKDLKVEGAVTALLKDAFDPNLVQTLEKTPTIIHGGPFANIAHGCNSVVATKLGIKLSDIVVTEAGFGADLGAEKFFDIKCRLNKINPSAVVLVVTIRALKFHGGVLKQDLQEENILAIENGSVNMINHIENLTKVFGMNVVVAINKFHSDTEDEINKVISICNSINIKVSLTEVFEKGSVGGIDLAKKVIETMKEKSKLKYPYKDEDSLKTKIEKISKKIYKAKRISYSKEAEKQLDYFEELGFAHLPVCIAKTQYSFSDNPKLLGSPKDFTINIRGVKLSAGAGFVVAYSGVIMTMPGLSKTPAAEKIDVDENGKISGLF